ncbi:MAG: hypothetical protein IJ899_15785 [Blautia sp.]|nr:hypothetical protein [Blautia sp.]
MKNLTAVDYVRTSLDHDFKSQAPIIQTWLENRMKDLDDEWIPVSDQEQADFQGILELLVYPFLVCYKALIDSDVSEARAGKYCQQIWKKMPVSIMETTLASLV